MAFRELEELYGGALERLFESPGSEPERICFAASVLPRSAERIVTDKLICEKGRHQYGSSSRVDMVHMYADPATFRLIGLWILSMLFHELPVRSTLALTHERCDIKNLACDFKHNGTFWGQGVFGYSSIPSRFFYHRTELRRHPWTGKTPDVWDLPNLLLTNRDDMVITDEEFEKRDTIVGFGNDFGAVHFAALLLDIGAPENARTEIDLEGELGFRGVAPGSVEVQLTTPGAERWVRVGLDYPDFGRREG